MKREEDYDFESDFIDDEESSYSESDSSVIDISDDEESVSDWEETEEEDLDY